MASTFASAVDTWIVLVLLVSMLLCCIGSFVLTISGQPLRQMVALLLSALGVILPAWVLLDTRYTVDDDSLYISCGPFKNELPITSIYSISSTRDARSSPALSLDRLRINFGDGRFVLVSPKDQQGFIEALGVATE